MSRNTTSRVISQLSVALLLCASPAQAQQLCYTLQEVNVPDGLGGDLYTAWFDINNQNQLVGNYCIDPGCAPVGPDGQVVGGAIHDLDDGSFVTFTLPYPYIYVGNVAINDRGVVVGEAANDAELTGFIRLADGNIFLIPLPLPTATTFSVTGINNDNVIVGGFADSALDGKYRGFRYEGGVYTILDFTASADGSYPHDINDDGDIAGRDFPVDKSHSIGFVSTAAQTYAVEDPSVYNLALWAISNRGPRRLGVGYAQEVAGAPRSGFVTRNGDFTYLTYPGAFDTQFHGVNDRGMIAGTFDAYSWGLVGLPCH